MRIKRKKKPKSELCDSEYKILNAMHELSDQTECITPEMIMNHTGICRGILARSAKMLNRKGYLFIFLIPSKPGKYGHGSVRYELTSLSKAPPIQNLRGVALDLPDDFDPDDYLSPE
jgi:hypothetical protein